MIQKILCVLLASLLPLMALAEHTHTPGEWDRDGENHWQVCACGEKMNVAPHILEDVLCAECQSEVWRYEDGAADVYNYDEHLEIVRSTFSILYADQKRGKPITTWPVDELYATLTTEKEKEELVKRVKKAYEMVAQKPLEGEIIRREYEME